MRVGFRRFRDQSNTQLPNPVLPNPVAAALVEFGSSTSSSIAAIANPINNNMNMFGSSTSMSSSSAVSTLGNLGVAGNLGGNNPNLNLPLGNNIQMQNLQLLANAGVDLTTLNLNQNQILPAGDSNNNLLFTNLAAAQGNSSQAVGVTPLNLIGNLNSGNLNSGTIGIVSNPGTNPLPSPVGVNHGCLNTIVGTTPAGCTHNNMVTPAGRTITPASLPQGQGDQQHLVNHLTRDISQLKKDNAEFRVVETFSTVAEASPLEKSVDSNAVDSNAVGNALGKQQNNTDEMETQESTATGKGKNKKRNKKKKGDQGEENTQNNQQKQNNQQHNQQQQNKSNNSTDRSNNKGKGGKGHEDSNGDSNRKGEKADSKGDHSHKGDSNYRRVMKGKSSNSTFDDNWRSSQSRPSSASSKQQSRPSNAKETSKSNHNKETSSSSNKNQSQKDSNQQHQTKEDDNRMENRVEYNSDNRKMLHRGNDKEERNNWEQATNNWQEDSNNWEQNSTNAWEQISTNAWREEGPDNRNWEQSSTNNWEQGSTITFKNLNPKHVILAL